MPVEFKNFPIVNVQKLMCAYFQAMFQAPNVVPLQWRYSDDPTKSKINIRAGFGEDIVSESAPSIIVARGTFSVDNTFMNKFFSAKANDFSDPKFLDTMNGSLDIICSSLSANEADCIASFISLMICADRHQLINNIPWVSAIVPQAIGPCTAAKQDAKTRRWITTLRLAVMLKVSWQTTYHEDRPEFATVWSKMDVYSADLGNSFASTGALAPAATVLTDASANFGLLNTNTPQIMEKELSEGFYYVFFKNLEHKFIVKSIVDTHTLELMNSDGTPASIPAGVSGDYKLVWNDKHFVVRLVA